MKTLKPLPLSAAAVAVVLATTRVGLAQPTPDPAVLLHQNFEEGNNLWLAFGPGANVSVTHEAANVKAGQAALQFDYTIQRGEFTALFLPTPQGVPKTVKSFKFWIKADYPTELVMALQENDAQQQNDGGRYLAVFYAAQGTWQQVELTPDDFILSEDPNDPKDPDNKLDLDQVQVVAIGDLKDLFIQADPTYTVDTTITQHDNKIHAESTLKVTNPVAEILNVKPGPHTFYLDEVSIGADPVALPFTVTDGTLDIDSFVHPQLSWIALGDAHLTRVEDKALNPAPGAVLQSTYHRAPDVVSGFAKRVPRQKFAGLQRLAFDATSAKPATLLVQVEEKGGGKYNTRLQVPGNNELMHVNLAFKDFKAAEDSHDANGKLDLDQVQQLLIIDASGAAANDDNTLHIGPLRGLSTP